MLLVVVAFTAAGFLGLLLAPGAAVVWMIVIGLGQEWRARRLRADPPGSPRRGRAPPSPR